jgi:hypothetical protein
MGPAAYQSKTDGFLYYCANKWVMDTTPITSGPFTSWTLQNQTTGTIWGEGALFCASPNGPLSGIRLENYRDGMQDYEYCRILAHLVAPLSGSTDARVTAAKGLLSVTWNIWNNDASVYESERSRLADAILSLQGMTGVARRDAKPVTANQRAPVSRVQVFDLLGRRCAVLRTGVPALRLGSWPEMGSGFRIAMQADGKATRVVWVRK